MMFKRISSEPGFRPPAEADSLILQVACGCPHNACAFCGMYKHVSYRVRPTDEWKALFSQEARKARNATRVFLADGDVMVLPFAELEAILRELQMLLPNLARVNLYGNGKSVLDKTPDELKALRALKLHTIYLGLESGDNATLQRMGKLDTSEEMIEACVRAQTAGLKMSVMVLLGLAGPERSAGHAHATAAALNRMQPRLLSFLRVIPVPGTRLHQEMKAGRFTPLTEQQVVEESRLLLEGLVLDKTVLRANHVSNIAPIEARLPRDKGAALVQLDRLLASGQLDATSPGLMPLWM